MFIHLPLPFTLVHKAEITLYAPSLYTYPYPLPWYVPCWYNRVRSRMFIHLPLIFYPNLYSGKCIYPYVNIIFTLIIYPYPKASVTMLWTHLIALSHDWRFYEFWCIRKEAAVLFGMFVPDFSAENEGFLCMFLYNLLFLYSLNASCVAYAICISVDKSHRFVLQYVCTYCMLYSFCTTSCSY